MHVSRREAAHVCGGDGTPTADRADIPSPTAEPDPYVPSALPTEDLEDLEDLCRCPASASAGEPAVRAVRPFPALVRSGCGAKDEPMYPPRCISYERGG